MATKKTVIKKQRTSKTGKSACKIADSKKLGKAVNPKRGTGPRDEFK